MRVKSMRQLKTIMLVTGLIVLFGLYVNVLSISTYAQNIDNTYIDRISKSADGRIVSVTYMVCEGQYACTTVDLFDSQTGQLIETVDLAPISPLMVVLDKTGSRIAYSTDYESGYYDRTTGVKTRIPFVASSIWFSWDPINSNLIAAASGSVLLIGDITSNDVISVIRTNGLISRFDWSPDGQYLVSDQTDDVINIWDRNSILTNSELSVPLYTITRGGSMDWHPDGTKLAMLEDPGFVIYDLASNQIVQEIAFDEEIPYVIRWSPDGSKIATGGETLRVWDTTTWELLEERTYDGTVGNLEWSPDSEHIFHDGGIGGLYRDDVPVHELVLTPEATEEP